MPIFNTQKLRANPEKTWFALDFLMLGLLIINLEWIIFDSLFAVDLFNRILRSVAPSLVKLYEPVHRNFILFDLGFVAIFLTDFCARWLHAIRNSTYPRWYFFPFIHWYDLIGCIPVSGLRLLRFLRVFSIIYRLDKYEVIDITQTQAFQFIDFYYDVFAEELTDRIVVKVLSGTQEELRHGSPVLHKAQQEILLPRKDLMVQWFSEKISEITTSGIIPNESELRRYIESVVDEAMENNRNLKRVRMIPMLGPAATELLERSVKDIVSEVIRRLITDIADKQNHGFIDELASGFFREKELAETEIDRQFLEIIIEVLELVKDQVQVRRWLQNLRKANTP